MSVYDNVAMSTHKSEVQQVTSSMPSMDPNSPIGIIPGCHMIYACRRLVATVRHPAPTTSSNIKLPKVLVQRAVIETPMDPHGKVGAIPNSHMLTTSWRTWGWNVGPSESRRWVPPQVTEVGDSIIATMNPEGTSMFIPYSHMVSPGTWPLIQLLFLIPTVGVEIKGPQIGQNIIRTSSVHPKPIGCIKDHRMYRTGWRFCKAPHWNFTPATTNHKPLDHAQVQPLEGAHAMFPCLAILIASLNQNFRAAQLCTHKHSQLQGLISTESRKDPGFRYLYRWM